MGEGDKPSKWLRWSGWAGLAAALAILAEWLWMLAKSIPPISRSDHLLALWRVAPAVEQGQWGTVAKWVFEFSGGHIIGYARALQLVNYAFFDYSGAFIKAAAIGSFAATWAAIAVVVLRTLGLGLASGIILAWSAWLVCNPVLANLAMWPESAPAFLVTTFVATLLVPWLAAGSWRSIAGGALAMAFTNGSGFVFLPAALLPRTRLLPIAIAVLAGAGLVLVLPRLYLAARDLSPAFAALAPFMDLGIVFDSLKRFYANPGLFVQYCFAVLVLPFAPYRMAETWWMGVVVGAYTALILARTDHRTPGPQRGWLVLAYFGLLSVLALAFGRFGYIDPARAAETVVTSHYAAVVLPLFVALGPLTYLALRGGPLPMRVFIAVAATALVGALGWMRAPVERDFSHAQRTEMAVQFGGANWNIFSAAVTLGSTTLGQIALLRVFPELKALGKYPELTRDLIVDPKPLGIEGARRETQGDCGRVYSFGPDTRHEWAVPMPEWAFMYSPRIVPFTRAVGYTTCAAPLVVMLGTDGAPLCVSRPGPLATRFTEPELAARPGMGERSFDFSCPGANAGSVWAFDPRRRVLVPLQGQP